MPLAGRAESTQAVQVYNNGYSFPDFYLCFERDILVIDRDNGEQGWWRFVIAYIHITSDGGWFGSKNFDLTVFNDSDLMQHYQDEFSSEDFSFISQSGYAFTRRLTLVPLCEPYPLSDGFSSVDLSFNIQLSNGYLTDTYYQVGTSSFSLTSSVVVALKAFSPSVILGEVAVENDNTELIEGALVVPTAPPLPSDGYINIEAIRHCAGALMVFPSSILVALMSTVSLSLGLSLFLILKHS